MNQAHLVEIKKCLISLRQIYKDNPRFDYGVLEKRVEEIINFLEDQLHDLKTMTHDIAKTLTSIEFLVSRNAPTSLTYFLILDSFQRFQRAEKVFHEIKKKYKNDEGIQIQSCLDELHQYLVQSKNSDDFQGINFETYGSQTAIEHLIESKIISQRARSLISNFLISDTNRFDQKWNDRQLKRIRNLLSDEEYNFYNGVFDSDKESSEVGTFNFYDKREALKCIIALMAYTLVCQENEKIIRNEYDHFPVITKEIRELTHQKFHWLIGGFQLSQADISDLIKTITSPNSSSFKKFFFSKKDF